MKRHEVSLDDFKGSIKEISMASARVDYSGDVIKIKNLVMFVNITKPEYSHYNVSVGGDIVYVGRNLEEVLEYYNAI